MKKEKELLYKALLPDSFHVQINEAEEGGYWVKTIEISCYAQGETLSDLFDTLTKSIYAYYDIPEKYIAQFGTYLPVESVRKSVSEQKPTKFTLDDILQKNRREIFQLQRVA